MTFLETSGFKYFKNFVIGVGASLVMLGALGKINSYEWGDIAITVGLVTEAVIFLFLGILPPQKDYYWENLYPGLDKVNSEITPLSAGGVVTSPPSVTAGNGPTTINPQFVTTRLAALLKTLRHMTKPLHPHHPTPPHTHST